MEKGWIDYLVPQVYWSMDLPVASHSKIVDWWSKNSKNTNLYIGNGPYKIRNNSDKAWNKKRELPNQLKLARNYNNVTGNVFFSAKSLMTNKEDVLRILKKKYYQNIALPPSSPLQQNTFENNTIPFKFEKNDEALQFSIIADNINELRYALIYASKKESKLNLDTPLQLLAKIPVPNSGNFNVNSSLLKGKKYMALTFINRFGQESKPQIIKIDR